MGKLVDARSGSPIPVMEDGHMGLVTPRSVSGYVSSGIPIWDRKLATITDMFAPIVDGEWIALPPGNWEKRDIKAFPTHVGAPVPPLLDALSESNLVYVPGAGGGTAAEEIATHYPNTEVVAIDNAVGTIFSREYSDADPQPENFTFRQASWDTYRQRPRYTTALVTYSTMQYGSERSIELLSDGAERGSRMYGTQTMTDGYFNHVFSVGKLTSRGWLVHLAMGNENGIFVAEKLS